MAEQQRWNYDGVIIRHGCHHAPMLGLLQHRDGAFELGARRRLVAEDGSRSWLFDFGSRADRTRELRCPGCGGRPRVNPGRLGRRAAGASVVVVD